MSGSPRLGNELAAGIVGRAVAADNLNVVIGWAPERRQRQLERGKVLGGALLGSKVGNTPARSHQEELIKGLPHARGGLVDGEKDGNLTLLGHLTQRLEDTIGKGRVEARKRLVQKEELWVCEQLGRNVEPLLLAAAQSTHRVGADEGMLAFLELQQRHDAMELGLLGGLAPLDGKAAHGRACEVVEHREPLKEDVLLHAVRDVATPRPRRSATVDRNVAGPLAALAERWPAGEDVEQRRLAGTRGTHDRKQLAGQRLTRRAE